MNERMLSTGIYGVKRAMAVRCFDCDRGHNGV